MDKSWIDKDRSSAEYISGIEKFLDFTFSNAEGSNMIIAHVIHASLDGNVSLLEMFDTSSHVQWFLVKLQRMSAS